jgi:hypothetical protein
MQIMMTVSKQSQDGTALAAYAATSPNSPRRRILMIMTLAKINNMLPEDGC